jgi:hypothetical protein
MRWRGVKKTKQAIAIAIICYTLLSLGWILHWSTNSTAQGGFTSYQARSAESFVDSIGVNTHINYQAYKESYDSIVKPKLQALGIRHVRQPLGDAGSDFTQMVSRFSALSNGSPAIKFDMISALDSNSSSSPQNSCFIPKLKVMMQGGTVPCGSQNGQSISASVKIDGIENTNEPDHCPSTDPVCDGFSDPSNWWQKSLTHNPNWPSETLTAAQVLQAKIQSDGTTSSIPILAPSLVWLAYYGDVTYPSGGGSLQSYMQPLRSYISRGTAHPYCHLQSIESCYNGQIAAHMSFFSGKPMIIGETGHSTATYSEKQQAKYTTSILFDFFARGIERTYIYELFDDRYEANSTTQNYGLINEDGREKMVYDWIKNTISLLNDSGGSPSLLEMNMSLPSGVKYVLLQKSDRSFWLALQNDKSNRTDTDSNKSVTIGFRSSKNVKYYNLESTNPYQTDSGTTALNFNVADRITLLQISDPSSSGGGGNGGNNGNGSTGGGKSGNASGSTSSNTTGKAGTKKGSTGSTTNTDSGTSADEGGFSLGPIQLKNATTFDRALNATILVGSILGLIFMIVTLVVARTRIAHRGDEFEDVDIED